MDLFEQLRREHEFGIGTIAGVAAKFGVHRRVVRQALSGALPPQHHYPERSKPKLGGLWRSLMRFWRRIVRRRASSGTRRDVCIAASWRNSLTSRSRSRRCATMCAMGPRPCAHEVGQPALAVRAAPAQLEQRHVATAGIHKALQVG